MSCILITFTKHANDKSTIDMTTNFLQFVNKAMEKMIDYVGYGVFVYIGYGHCTGFRWQAVANPSEAVRNLNGNRVVSCSCRAVSADSARKSHRVRAASVQSRCRDCTLTVQPHTHLKKVLPISRQPHDHNVVAVGLTAQYSCVFTGTARAASINLTIAL